jgi:hypothetical protein
VLAIDVGAQRLHRTVADLIMMRNRRAAFLTGGASIFFSAYWTAFWRADRATYWPV